MVGSQAKSAEIGVHSQEEKALENQSDLEKTEEMRLYLEKEKKAQKNLYFQEAVCLCGSKQKKALGS